MPRGLELLNQIGGHRGTPMGGSQRAALQTYWVADQAQVSVDDPAVHAWLKQAKDDASHVMPHDKKPLANTIRRLCRARCGWPIARYWPGKRRNTDRSS